MFNRNDGTRWANDALQVDVKRSVIPISFHSLTTGNSGFLNPICAPIEVLPGDEFPLQCSALIRSQTPIFPTMGRAWIDTFWFYVPMRLVWDHTKQFFGESDVAGYDSSSTYEIPSFGNFTPDTDFLDAMSGSSETNFPLSDGFGIPNNIWNHGNSTDSTLQINVLPFRAYRLIWNTFFRDQNLQNPLTVNTGDDENDSSLFYLSKTNKLHDYFTSALPFPQKGPDVLLPIASDDYAPVVTRNAYVDRSLSSNAMSFWTNNADIPYSDVYYPLAINSYPNPTADPSETENIGDLHGLSGSDSISPALFNVRPSNLWASLENSITGPSILQLRQAFATQKLYEDFSLYGSRYHEMLRSIFGVLIPESVVQIPEYLGGQRIKLNMQQVTQTSGNNGSGEILGSQGAYSLTTFSNLDFDKTFTEHGYIIGLWTIRNENLYQNGVHRLWTRKDMLDFYWPQFANIGSQPIYRKEIFTDLSQSLGENNTVFGYQERNAEYRYIPSQVSGEFRSSSSTSLDALTYADSYISPPLLNSSWIQSDPTRIGKTLTTSYEYSDQFYCDFLISMNARRKMPAFGGHSIQGWL